MTGVDRGPPAPPIAELAPSAARRLASPIAAAIAVVVVAFGSGGRRSGRRGRRGATTWRRLALAALLSAVALVASSCGSSDGDSESPPAATPEKVGEAPDATLEAERDGAAGRSRYQMIVEEAPSRASARAQDYAFRIERSSEQTVRDFQVEHTKRMHVIVVRSDLIGFQHLHPTMADDGTWRGSIGLRKGGEYRMFADFKHAGRRRTLAADVPVDGEFKRVRLPAPSPYARTDGGLDVALYHHGSGAGAPAHVQFEVAEQGRPVTAELQPYLGAMGHLVAIREDDLRYLHTHPDGAAPAFHVEYPTAGNYRVFVQFRHRGRVHTAAFTVAVPA
jgi:hypothetical protein